MRFRLLTATIALSLSITAQNRETDSLKHILSSAAADTVKLQALTDLNWIFSQSEFELSKYYGWRELQLARKSGNKKWIAQAYNDIAISCYKLDQLDSALHYNNLSLNIRRTLKDDNLIASSLSKIGVLQVSTGNFSKALNSQLEALRVFEKAGNEPYIAITYNNISQVYGKMMNYDKEIEYGEKSLALHLKAKDMYHVAQVYSNIGSSWRQKKNYKKADEYLQKALALFKGMGDISGEAGVYNNIGITCKMQNRIQQAGECYKKAYDLSTQINEHAGIALYGHNISVNLTEQGKFAEAKKYSLKVLEMTEPHNKTQLLIVYRQLATIYGFMNEGKKADHYLNRYVELKDSLFDKESAAQVAEMEVKYLTEKKDLELARNKAELEARDRLNFIKNIIIASIVVIMLLIAMLSWSVYKRRQIKQQAATDIELARQKELRSKAVVDAEEKERRRIAQDLHDGVGQILSAAKLNLSGLEDKLQLQDEQQKLLLSNALELINDSVKEVRLVSHNMIPNTLIKLGLASAVREFISRMGAIPQLKIDLQIVGLNSRIDNTVETVLYRVIQEVVSNIIKHARATEISMQLVEHDQEITIIIEDNGIGFDKSIEFEGIGLKNIISRVEFLNGHVEFDSMPGQGTTVVIEVPLT